jgi:periplasmic copper chaperone A
MKLWLLLAAFLAAAPAQAQVKIENAWARATPPGTTMAAGYLTIRNSGAAADRLLAVTSAAAENVQPHITVKDGDILRMREVKGYDIPAKGALELKPGGSHLMFVNIKAPFKEGDKVPATLRFDKAGEVSVEFRVRGLGES